MFKKMTLMVATLMMATLFTGCIKIKMETKLKKDGSGKGKVELTVIPKITKALEEVKDIPTMPETPIGNMANLDEDTLKEQIKGRDVKIKKFKNEIKDGSRKIKIEMDFKNLEDYSFVLSTIFDEPGSGLGVFDAGDGNLRLKDAEYKIPAPDPAAEEEELVNPNDEAMEVYLELMPLINSTMGEVEVINIITVPGDVIESDATEIDGRTCTWTLDFATIRSDKDALKPNIVFSGKGMKIKPLADQ